MSHDLLQKDQARLARLYQNTADKMRGQRDGVVVTPVEIVDFQIRAIKNLEALQKIIEEDGPSTEPLVFVNYPRYCITKEDDGAIFINPRTLQGSVAKIYLDLEDVDALLNIFKTLITDLTEVQP